jgi:hypothetical protein
MTSLGANASLEVLIVGRSYQGHTFKLDESGSVAAACSSPEETPRASRAIDIRYSGVARELFWRSPTHIETSSVTKASSYE